MRWIKLFGEGRAEEKDLLGGKGANLSEMTRMGLPVPFGFTVTTEACRAYLAGDGALPEGLLEELREALAEVEQRSGRTFGGGDDPMLLSVRSGARFSMPGMMDTVLNLGVTGGTVDALAAAYDDRHFAADSARRFREMYGTVVMGVDHEVLAAVRRELLGSREAPDATALDADTLLRLADRYDERIEAVAGEPIPGDPREQLRRAVEAVFRSWNTERARSYRRIEGLPDDLGTAVNVQMMVYGNAGEDSATGVAFTRDPATGDPSPYGDFLLGAQGEDVVAGVRRTRPLSELADVMPGVHSRLTGILDRLERRYRDMCDIEFTVERGSLWILQTRIGKRSAPAAARMAVSMVDEELIERTEAVRRLAPAQLEQLLHPRFDPAVEVDALTEGLAASPGAASGHVVFTAREAVDRAGAGEDVILLRPETAAEDVDGMAAARGILTSRGGLVSHAAVVARGMGIPAVCGVADMEVDPDAGVAHVGDAEIRADDVVSIDGSTGRVVLGEVALTAPEVPDEVDVLLGWADELRRLGVRANADTPEDARRAVEAGAEGIGLCRTEHMFLGDRVDTFRRVILAEDETEAARALDRLEQVQQEDFEEILEAMDGRPVTVRLLDPPLHEFLPDLDELIVREARGRLDEREQRMLEVVRAWRETNPMLGVRGVRLGLIRPELYATQVRALTRAAARCAESGGDPRPEIMIPLVALDAELADASELVRGAIDEVLDEESAGLDIPVGTMIETPRAALTARRLADRAEFISFGTNDLTQLTFGFSRDDLEARLLPEYEARGILATDPFLSIDVDGVAELVRLAVEAARRADTPTELGVCGEHGGDPESIRTFHRVGLGYVSCSPTRLRTARLAAAQAAVGEADRGA